MGAVICLSESDAGAAAGDEAGVDGGEAAEEAIVPWTSVHSLLSSVLLRVGERVRELVLPVLDITIVNGTVGLLCSGHCELWESK